MKSITLKKGKERSIERKHHWVFSGAIAKKDAGIVEGELLRLVSSADETLAFGHYGEKSISLRILSFEKEFNESEFWFDAINKAYQRRQALQLSDTNAYRLVHAEGDELPGLVIDCYNKAVVVQTHSKGMSNAIEHIEEALKKILGAEIEIVNRSAEKNKEKLPSKVVEALEHGMKFKVDVSAGQKTGFFIDQRDNRALLRSLSKDKKVLNVFSYTGGFSLAAAYGGANSVTSVDLSETAINLCTSNIEENKFPKSLKHSEHVKDAFDFIKEDSMDYDIVVLDPPAFAKHLSAKKNAMKAYERLNESAIRKMKAGSLLLTFSCSQVVSKQDFRYAILNAGWRSGRGIKILKELGQSADHPVNLYHPETDYLKGFLLYID